MTKADSALEDKDRPPRFRRWYGIDYSGAGEPDRGLTGLRWYAAEQGAVIENESGTAMALPQVKEVRPDHGGHWSRRSLAEALASRLGDGVPTMVGVDHAFSLPLAYYEKHGLRMDWRFMLEDFCAHWPTDRFPVEAVRRGGEGRGGLRTGDSRWRRRTDKLARAKSPFHFDVPGSVAKSTHAGLPWLRWLSRELGECLHVWPFDGWRPRDGRSVMFEVYPSLWNRQWPTEGRTPDQHDAWAVARCLMETDFGGFAGDCWQPLNGIGQSREILLEGWIFGLR